MTRSTDSRRPRPAAIAALAVLAAAVLAAVYVFGVRPDMSDFGVCTRAGSRLLAGETLYRVQDGHLQYKYAPAAALLYAPLAGLPWEAAKLVWFLVMAALLAGCLFVAIAALPDRRRRPAGLALLALLVLGKFLGREFQLGQVNLLILFLLLVFLSRLLAGRDAAAGAFWALSLFFKPYALILLPYLVLKGRWKALAAGAGVLAAGLAAPALLLGWAGNLRVLGEWANTLSASTPGLLLVGDNASLWALLGKHAPSLPESGLRGLVLAAAALLGALFLWVLARRSRGRIAGPEYLETAFLLVLIPLLSPLGWYYNYLYALPAVVLLADRFAGLPGAWRIVLFADLLIIGGTLREVLGKTIFRFYTHHALVAVNALLLLVVLAAVRDRRRA